MTRRITDVVSALARRTPNDQAIIDIREHGVAVWTWEKLWRESSRIAALLLRLGVQSGEVVAYQLPNSREFVAVTLAALRIGAVCCPLPAIFREHELTFVLSRSKARVVFAADVFRGRHHALEIASLEGQLPFLQHLIVVKENDQRGALPVTRRITCVRLYRAVRSASLNLTEIDQRRPAEDFPAQLLFTSGTSGVPKGVIHRHDVLMNAATLHVAQLGLDTGDRIFVPSPLAHQTGFLYGMWVAWLLGVPQILQAVWDPGRAVRMLREWHGTFTQAAPTFLADLVRTVQAGVRAPSTLRLFVPTGATVPRTLAQEAERVLHCQICGAFGTTEGCLATLASPADARAKASGTDGRPLPGVQIRVCDDSGAVLPPNEEGHLQTHSPTMFEGYLDEPVLTAQAYTSDGWYRTADLAVIDPDGYLYIRGRVNDVINRGGEKIPVAQVEQLLYQHAAVEEIAIVAMPDDRLGERVCAFVVLRPGASLDFSALRSFLDERRVAKQYWPERLEVLAALPKTPSGKIKKYVLREQARALSAVPRGAAP